MPDYAWAAGGAAGGAAAAAEGAVPLAQEAVVDNGDGTYAVTYTISEDLEVGEGQRGPLKAQLQVAVNGAAIADSPFALEIRLNLVPEHDQYYTGPHWGEWRAIRRELSLTSRGAMEWCAAGAVVKIRRRGGAPRMIVQEATGHAAAIPLQIPSNVVLIVAKQKCEGELSDSNPRTFGSNPS